MTVREFRNKLYDFVSEYRDEIAIGAAIFTATMVGYRIGTRKGFQTAYRRGFNRGANLQANCTGIALAAAGDKEMYDKAMKVLSDAGVMFKSPKK